MVANEYPLWTKVTLVLKTLDNQNGEEKDIVHTSRRVNFKNRILSWKTTVSERSSEKKARTLAFDFPLQYLDQQ